MVRFICMLRGERRLENWIILILLFPNLWRLYSELEAVTVQVLLYSPGHGDMPTVGVDIGTKASVDS